MLLFSNASLGHSLNGKIGMQYGNYQDEGYYHGGEAFDGKLLMGMLGGELLIDYTKEYSFGCGVEAQIPYEAMVGEKMSFIPIYLLLRYYAYSVKNADIYISGKAGYNFFNYQRKNLNDQKINIDTNGGFYYSIGVGIVLKNNVFLELDYAVNKGTYEDVDINHNVILKKASYYTFGIGNRFEFLFLRSCCLKN